MENLFQRSIEVVSDNQGASGAHITSPDLPFCVLNVFAVQKLLFGTGLSGLGVS